MHAPECWYASTFTWASGNCESRKKMGKNSVLQLAGFAKMQRCVVTIGRRCTHPITPIIILSVIVIVASVDTQPTRVQLRDASKERHTRMHPRPHSRSYTTTLMACVCARTWRRAKPPTDTTHSSQHRFENKTIQRGTICKQWHGVKRPTRLCVRDRVSSV